MPAAPGICVGISAVQAASHTSVLAERERDRSMSKPRSPQTTKTIQKRTRAPKGTPLPIPSADLPLLSIREVQVQYTAKAPHLPPQKRIHPRRQKPAVPPGPPTPDARPTPALALQPPQHATTANRPQALLATANVVLLRNVELGSAADNSAAADVDEPSTASNGNAIFYTGNWYAALSTDGGATFQFVDPFNAFPDPPGMGFCCDQVVQYIPRIDTFIWLLQYSQNQDPKKLF